MSIIEIDPKEQDYVPGGGLTYLEPGLYEGKFQILDVTVDKTPNGNKYVRFKLGAFGENAGKTTSVTYWLTEKGFKYFKTFCKWVNVLSFDSTKIEQAFQGVEFDGKVRVVQDGEYTKSSVLFAEPTETEDDDLPF